jgi:hypothetical protein
MKTKQQRLETIIRKLVREAITEIKKSKLNEAAVNTSGWKVDTGIKKRVQTRSPFGNITTSNDVKFLVSPNVKVFNTGNDDVYVFTDGERELVYKLPETGPKAHEYKKVKTLSKARPEVSAAYKKHFS